MNVKRYLIASIVVFIILGFIDFLFDFFILSPLNNSLKNLWRTDMIFWLEPALYLASSLLFVFIFTLTRKGKGVIEGVIFGILMGILVSGVHSFRQYAVYPLPLNITVIWFIEGLIQYVIAGIAAAMIYKPKK